MSGMQHLARLVRLFGMASTRRAGVVLLLGALLAVSMWSPSQAGRSHSYSDPDDSRGNLDVVKVSGSRILTPEGIAFRTVITMEDNWLDHEIDLDFNLTERGARWSSCGGECTGKYYGDINYDPQAQAIRAQGFEATKCGCIDVEWPVGRYDSRSLWFDLPESYLYDGTYAMELGLSTESPRQTEPIVAPICMTRCRDEVERMEFPTWGRP